MEIMENPIDMRTTNICVIWLQAWVISLVETRFEGEPIIKVAYMTKIFQRGEE
jgi:hypothetical protein